MLKFFCSLTCIEILLFFLFMNSYLINWRPSWAPSWHFEESKRVGSPYPTVFQSIGQGLSKNVKKNSCPPQNARLRPNMAVCVRTNIEKTLQIEMQWIGQKYVFLDEVYEIVKFWYYSKEQKLWGDITLVYQILT